MKVQPGRQLGQVAESREAGPGKLEQAKAKAPEEQIKVSSLSKLISEFRTNTDGVVDPAKVSQLKSDIQSGNFKVNPEEVAAAMIREES
jgi:flagellar biosynthesis anti-sigma factor FlgM